MNMNWGGTFYLNLGGIALKGKKKKKASLEIKESWNSE